MENDNELASSLRTATSKFYKRLKNQLKLEDSYSLTELSTLFILFNNKTAFPSELADKVKVKAQSMSQILNRLEALQLITKTPSGSDKRKTAIALSANGRKMVEKTRHDRDEWLAGAIAQNLSAKEKEALRLATAIIEKLADTN